MGNIIDYAHTETRTFGPTDAETRAFGAVDALVLAALSYQKMPGIVPTLDDVEHRYRTVWRRLALFSPRHPLASLRDVVRAPFGGPTLTEIADHLYPADFSVKTGHAGLGDPRLTERLYTGVAASPRFGPIRVAAYEERFSELTQTQFAAVTMLIPMAHGDGHAADPDEPAPTLAIAFRGTDDSFVGWKEDFNMAFQYPIPAQRAAADYVTRVARIWRGPIVLLGHSKGGNLAVYAAMNVDTRIRRRIVRAYSLDGPGFPRDVVAGSAAIESMPPVEKIVPDSSIVGMILETPEPCIVVRSDQKGIMQHLSYSWQIGDDGEFERAPGLKSGSQYFNKALNDWLTGLTYEQRERAVDALFRLLDSTGANSLSSMLPALPKSIPDMVNSFVGLSDEDRRNLLAFVNLLVRAMLMR